MEYRVMIDKFEGPLDLLLHLIKENNIDIYDIKIEDITKQYLDYIEKMKDLNLSVASEYLVMASELVEMKSKMLLPKPKVEDDDEYEEDPKEALIERLLAYKQYKEITSSFKELELSRKLILTKEPENLSCYVKEEDKEDSLEINVLIEALNNLLSKKQLDKPLTTKITKKEVSLSHKVEKIKNILKIKKKVDFEELFEEATKEDVIISFLSILEMIKKDEIIVEQDENFNKITIALKEGEER